MDMEQFYESAKQLPVIIGVMGLIMIGLWIFLRKK
jgi:LPXTG-motif cell wall-anchored protein